MSSPAIVKIEGSLFDAAGSPYTGSRDIRIDAYDAASGGSSIWSSSVTNATISSGRFSINLDASTGSPSLVSRIADKISSDSVWFEIVYDTGTANGTMNSPVSVSPRIRGKGSLFALASAKADSISGVTATTAELNRLAGVTGNIQTQLQRYWGQYCNTDEALRGFDSNGTPACVSLYSPPSFTKVHGGYISVCGLLANGQLRCWGYNGYSQTGNGATANVPEPVVAREADGSPISNVTDVAAGAYTTCVLKTNGTVWCWGYNGHGGLGDGTNTARTYGVQVTGITSATQISMGNETSCVRKSDSTVWCWGYNNNSAIGDGTATDKWTPTQVSGLTDAVQVDVGDGYTCAVRSGGGVRCWGYNGYGNLGDNSVTARNTPVDVVNLTGVSFVSAAANIGGGFQHTCALKTDGTVWCWGYGGNGELGDGAATTKYSPTQVQGITNAAKIAVAGLTSCAVLGDGTAKCWGYNNYGQLCDGTVSSRYSPVSVLNSTGSAALTGITYVHMTEPSSSWLHTTYFISGGRMLACGYNNTGTLGINTVDNSSHTLPVGAHYP